MTALSRIHSALKCKYLIVLFYMLFISAGVFAQSFNIGHTTMVFYDDVRNRNIETEIYYPSDAPGEDVAVASGSFPVVVFGHGFLMSWESYQNFWTELVPNGYVICFPTTEMGMSPNHEDLGLDLKFVASQMQSENENSTSMFFNSLAPKTGLMGHSMGGGASFLAAENNSAIHSLINFAAAETNPSAIAASTNISCPALIFAGDDDCVSPPDQNQDLMYANLASECKTQITIINGSHCYFADYDFTCSLGESFCNPALDITREEQHSVTFDFLNLWLDYSLYDDQQAFDVFNDSLQQSDRINFLQSCYLTGMQNNEQEGLALYPNPVFDEFYLVLAEENTDGLLIINNIMGEKVFQRIIHRGTVDVKVSNLPDGIYILEYLSDSGRHSCKFVKATK